MMLWTWRNCMGSADSLIAGRLRSERDRVTTSAADASAPVTWRVQGAVYGIGVFTTSVFHIGAVIIPLYAYTMNPSPFVFGLIFAAGHVLPWFFSIHAGALMDRLGARRVMLESGLIDVPVYDFAALGADQAVAGPAIVESDTTTVLLLPGDAARMDARGWLEITLPEQG